MRSGLIEVYVWLCGGEGWLERNPMSRIKLEKEIYARDRVLEPEEYTWLQAHSALRLQAMNLMAHLMGRRQGEILL